MAFATSRLYPDDMTELDEVWSKMLDTAATRADDEGRHGVADFLRLKASNDAIRVAGVHWLFDTVVKIASSANRGNVVLSIERDDPHNFTHGTSNIVGSRVMVRHGVRCLTVEAGWTRTPTDGIMLGGALAFAQLSHFGIPRMTTELKLVADDPFPKWLDAETFDHVGSKELKRHIDILTT